MVNASSVEHFAQHLEEAFQGPLRPQSPDRQKQKAARSEFQVLDGYKVSDPFIELFDALDFRSIPHWENAVLKLIPCDMHVGGLVCIVVGTRDWRVLHDQLRDHRIREKFIKLSKLGLMHPNQGTPYAIVVYSGEVPSKARPNTAVGYFCHEAEGESDQRRGQDILDTIVAAANRQYPDRTRSLKFGPVVWQVDGVGSAYIASVGAGDDEMNDRVHYNSPTMASFASNQALSGALPITVPKEDPVVRAQRSFLGLTLTGGTSYPDWVNIGACVTVLGSLVAFPLWLFGVPYGHETLKYCLTGYLLLATVIEVNFRDNRDSNRTDLAPVDDEIL